MKVLDILDAGLSVGENPHMYYFRGLLYLHMGMNMEALEDVDRAIEKSEDNVARYFFLRGVIFMMDHNYEHALSEFSTCISIDDSIKDAYLERGKCHFLIGENLTAGYIDIYEHADFEKWKTLFALHKRDFEELTVDSADESICEVANFHQFKFNEAGAAGKLIIAIKCENFSQVKELLCEALDIGLGVGALQIEDILFLKAYCLYRT